MRTCSLIVLLLACAPGPPAPPTVDVPGGPPGGATPGAYVGQSGQGRDLFSRADLDLGRPRLERPERFVFDTPSTRPELFQMRVRLERAAQSRLVYTISEDGRSYQVMVEPADAATFQVVSRGAAGTAGLDGSAGLDGASGLAGSDASCPSTNGTDGVRGGDGETGGPGGAGASGGDGGNILVDVVCPGGACDELVAVARRSVISEGGPGGAGGGGGRGGDGGPGGRGGNGTVCLDSDGNLSALSGGLDGPPGFDGTRGWDGLPGSPGAAGHVEIRLVE
jgi:hypothetical protein